MATDVLHVAYRCFASALLIGLYACGGGSGGDTPPGGSSGSGGGGGGGGSSGIPWVSGVFQASSSFAAQCVTPRTGTNPRTGRPYPDLQGSVSAENHWLRSWTNELYLWYREVQDRNPAGLNTQAYFDLLKTTAVSASGAPKDRFHFLLATEEWEQLAQSGVSVGYGAQWVIIAPTPPRRIVVAYAEPNSPATAPAVNLARGAEVVSVDGIDLVNDNTQTGVDRLNAGLFPATAGENHTFRVRDPGAASDRTVFVQSADVSSVPVQNVGTIATATGTVGYMLFNEHIATAESALIEAINTLTAANVSDLVLDIRYNGGGFLDIANELAYMIAGSAPTAGRPFERLVFSDKHPATNPVTGEPLAPLPFHTSTQGFSVPRGQPLPSLNLPRVFVLTGANTCSASESIINSLRGVDVEVIQIGSTTCGKPYGFYPADNCGTTYFSIQFKGENAKGFGDYGDGFAPANTTTAGGTLVPGCSVGDDFTEALGDVDERRLAAALQYRASQVCPAPTGLGLQKQTAPVSDGLMYKSPWHENRILRD